MLCLSVALYFFVSILTCHVLFQNLSLPRIIIVFFITFFSLNILICEILSLVNILSSPLAFIGIQLVFCSVIFWVLWRNKNPQIKELFTNRVGQKFSYKPLNVFVFLLICINLGILFFVGINTPPNNLDSLHTHLLRIYYWLQHGSFESWLATAPSQLIYPINAHIQGLWLFLLGGREELFFLVQWISLIAICCSIYEIARLFKLSINQSLFSCLVFFSFPIVLLQTYSFQNDLPVVTLISIFIFLIFSYKASKNINELRLAMLVLALALGVKQTAFVVLPILVLWIVYMFIKKQIDKKHRGSLALFLVFFLLFSSYKNIQNILEFRSFFGVDNLVVDQPMNIQYIANKAKYNIPRFMYDFIDFEGLGSQTSQRLTNLKAEAFKYGTSLVNINLEEEIYLSKGYDKEERFIYLKVPSLTEDTSWLGPLCFLLVPICTLLVLIQKNPARKEYIIFAILLNLSYFFGILLQRPGWDPFQGRYFILSIIPFVPLLGICVPNKGVMKYVIYLLICCAYLYISFNVLFLNSSKPLITAKSIVTWQNESILYMPKQTKIQIIIKNKLVKSTNQLSASLLQRSPIFDEDYYGQLFYSNTSTLKDMELVNSVIPQSEPIFLMISRDPLEYGLFGVNRSRNLYPVDSIRQVEKGAYLLIENSRISSMNGFILIKSNDRYSIYQREE